MQIPWRNPDSPNIATIERTASAAPRLVFRHPVPNDRTHDVAVMEGSTLIEIEVRRRNSKYIVFAPDIVQLRRTVVDCSTCIIR